MRRGGPASQVPERAPALPPVRGRAGAFRGERLAFPGVEVVPYQTRLTRWPAEFPATSWAVTPSTKATCAPWKIRRHRRRQPLCRHHPHRQDRGRKRSSTRTCCTADRATARQVDDQCRRPCPAPGALHPPRARSLTIGLRGHAEAAEDGLPRRRGGHRSNVNGDVLACQHAGLRSQPASRHRPPDSTSACSEAPDKPMLIDPARRLPPVRPMLAFVGLAGLPPGLPDKPEHGDLHRQFFIPGQSPAAADIPLGPRPGRPGAAIAKWSVNTYFYQLCPRHRASTASPAISRQFGFGRHRHRHYRKAARCPSPSGSGQHDQVWYPGETVIPASARGYPVVTPVQLAHVALPWAPRRARAIARDCWRRRTLGAGSGRSADGPRPARDRAAGLGRWAQGYDRRDALRHGPPTPPARSRLHHRRRDRHGTGSPARSDAWDTGQVSERRAPRLVHLLPAEGATKIAVAVVLESAGLGRRGRCAAGAR